MITNRIVSVTILSLAIAGMWAGNAYADSHRVKGYITKNGTYVPPARATNPDSTKLNNWSTSGNVNPYTGKAGTKDPYKPKSAK